jgi:hypothetical protein
MGDFAYKQYSPEEDMIHEETINRIREGMQNGLSFNESCSTVNIEDKELKSFILADALKILIAEMHYARGMSLPQVASELKVPLDKLIVANREMIEDVGASAAEVYHRMNTDAPIGNA